MVVESANLIGGIILSAPITSRIDWLRKPVEKITHTLEPYRTPIGLAEVGVGVTVGLCQFGILDIPLFYGGSLLEGGFSIVMGGLVANPFVERYIPRKNPLCDPLHTYKAPIGVAGALLGALGLLGLLL